MTVLEIWDILMQFLLDARRETLDMPANRILNMDETPCFFDMVNSTTLEFKSRRDAYVHTYVFVNQRLLGQEYQP